MPFATAALHAKFFNPVTMPMFMRIVAMIAAIFVALVGSGLPAAAQLPSGDNHVAALLVAESGQPRPGGDTVLAFAMTPAQNWHGYWENPGDAGQPMTVEWTLPAGVTVGKAAYPVPGILRVDGLINHVYDRPYALLVPLRLASGIVPGTRLPIVADARWLACDDKVCVPERARLTLDLVAGAGAIAPDSRSRFDAWRARLPRPLDTGVRGALYQRAGGDIRIGVKLPADAPLVAPHLFIADDEIIAPAAPQRFFRNGDWLVIETRAASITDAEQSGTIDALLRLAPDKGLRFAASPARAGELPASGHVIADGDAPAFDWHLLLIALGGAIVGGVILNIMPCVFPILSLKALTLSRVGGDPRQVRQEAWAYASGVVGVCLALGGIILTLRAAGESVGWAFQLQNPVIVFLLLLLVAAIAANLAGLFELTGPSLTVHAPDPADAPRPFAAFAAGALAAAVATPCTGPFMGAALGATLVLPPWAALVIFGGLGTGLALPFLLIAYVPGLRARLPRPGAWMESFRKWMALPMALTALALVWLLGRLAGSAGLAVAAAGLAAVASAAFVYGRGQRGARQQWPMAALPLLFLLPTAIGGAAILARQAPAVNHRASLGGQAYSDARLAALRAAGRPVFVYFTADWCVTCKANEAAAIDRVQTAQAFRQGKVAVLVGDWTDGDPAITRTLAAHGRNSVPLYLFYRPGKAEPEQLPQILTPAMLAGLPR